jgi:hypothetical protein
LLSIEYNHLALMGRPFFELPFGQPFMAKLKTFAMIE